MDKVIWKDVVGYEGLYKVSNNGDIYSLPRNRKGAYDCTIKVNGGIIKQSINSCGYKLCGLSKNGKQTLHLVHKIVAQAFIPNPNNLTELNHIDENKTNNNVNNLEWCCRSYNKLYNDNAKIGARKFCKPVAQYTIDGEQINYFSSITEAISETNISHIGDCCNGKLKQAGGYIWRFV